MAHGHKFAKLKFANHQNLAIQQNLATCTSKIFFYGKFAKNKSAIDFWANPQNLQP